MIILILEYLFISITGLTAIGFLIKIIIQNLKTKNNKFKDIIQWPRIYSYVGIVTLFVDVAINIMLILDDLNNEEVLYNMLSFSFIFIIGLIICIMSLNWKIVLEDKSFIFTNYIGIKKRYSYDDVKIQIHRPASLRYRIEDNSKTKIIISTMCNNAYGLENRINRRYYK